LVTTRGQVKRDIQRGREASSLISTIWSPKISHAEKGQGFVLPIFIPYQSLLEICTSDFCWVMLLKGWPGTTRCRPDGDTIHWGMSPVSGIKACSRPLSIESSGTRQPWRLGSLDRGGISLITHSTTIEGTASPAFWSQIACKSMSTVTTPRDNKQCNTNLCSILPILLNRLLRPDEGQQYICTSLHCGTS
jgi:hypothetical protein